MLSPLHQHPISGQSDASAVGLLSGLAPSSSKTTVELRLKLPPTLDPLGETAVFTFKDATTAATLLAMKEGSINIGRKIADSLDAENAAELL
jgi:hypothetical protein